MSITEKIIKKTANLAKLNFEGEELAKFAKEFNSIVDMVDSLQNVDVNNIEYSESLTQNQVMLRSDIVQDGNRQKELFSNISGPDKVLSEQLSCFIVPKVMDIEE